MDEVSTLRALDAEKNGLDYWGKIASDVSRASYTPFIPFRTSPTFWGTTCLELV